ncbi:MAG: DMT family protein [Alphaproteobacteria bacterium]|nr:DMT family protein [Alphaproteobacteria bacterium]
MPFLPTALTTILLLIASNVLMTIAWYWHLKHTGRALWAVILISWGIAFFEYCLAVPANRIGYGTFSGQQLKVMQEVITLGVFAVFAVLYLGERLAWNYFAAMACLVAAVLFIFLPVGGAAVPR